MPTLVPVPWQPECLLTPATLAYLIAASNRLGTQLQIDGQDGAWRPYARQAYLYGGYINHVPGFNTASNPDTGQRNHMRGDAFDLIRTDAAAQAACRAVGLVRDAAESWHWNNPNWANDPIIPTAPGVTIAADGTYSSVLTGGFLMALSDTQQRQVYEALVQGGESADAFYKTDALINIIRGELAPIIQEARDALVKPSPYSGKFRPIDVLVSQVPAILQGVTAQGGASSVPTDAQVKALADALKAGLGAAVADELAKRLVS